MEGLWGLQMAEMLNMAAEVVVVEVLTAQSREGLAVHLFLQQVVVVAVALIQ